MSERYSTLEALNNGVLDRPIPENLYPDGLIWEEMDDLSFSRSKAERLLQEGRNLEVVMYYGVFRIWQTQDKFSGQLRQYRRTTDFFDNELLQDALRKATEWAEDCSDRS